VFTPPQPATSLIFCAAGFSWGKQQCRGRARLARWASTVGASSCDVVFLARSDRYIEAGGPILAPVQQNADPIKERYEERKGSRMLIREF